MIPRERIVRALKASKFGVQLAENPQYRRTVKSVSSLILHLAYAFYNGILGYLTDSLIFAVSSIYYLVLSGMRFSIVLLEKKGKGDSRVSAWVIGIMLIILSIVFHIMVLLSMKYQTAAIHSTIPMIAIATFTFTKITAAIVTAVRQRKAPSGFCRNINTIRYAEVAVSLLTMQQSMLASFGNGSDTWAVILNACTGAGVCGFILVLGILTVNQGKEQKT